MAGRAEVQNPMKPIKTPTKHSARPGQCTGLRSSFKPQRLQNMMTPIEGPMNQKIHRQNEFDRRKPPLLGVK